MRWGKMVAPRVPADRYVRRFALWPMYDFDADETVWLEWFHKRQWRGMSSGKWWDYNRSLRHGANDKEIISDSRIPKPVRYLWSKGSV